MLQFYFLSVLLNIAAGLILVYGQDISSAQEPGTAAEQNSAQVPFFNNRTFRLVLGILDVFVGVMKLLSVVQNDVPVIGDLIPALAGLAGGTCILLEYYLHSTTVKTTLPHIIQIIFIDNKKYIGIGCLVAGLLHFVFPKVLLL